MEYFTRLENKVAFGDCIYDDARKSDHCFISRCLVITSECILKNGLGCTIKKQSVGADLIASMNEIFNVKGECCFP